jgi:hypothetical protein
LEIYSKLEKEKLIKAEKARLNRLYKDLPAATKKAAEGLIARAAYMKITLQEYETDMDLNGYVELFSQSSSQEPYERERPVARLYANLAGKYVTICKELKSLQPKHPESPKDELMDWLKEHDALPGR